MKSNPEVILLNIQLENMLWCSSLTKTAFLNCDLNLKGIGIMHVGNIMFITNDKWDWSDKVLKDKFGIAMNFTKELKKHQKVIF